MPELLIKLASRKFEQNHENAVTRYKIVLVNL